MPLLGAVLLIFSYFMFTMCTADFGCSEKAKKMGLSASYELSTGCMVQVGQRWVPLENYRVLGE